MADQSSTNDLEDFLEFSNSELQFYLQQRGLSTTGTHGSLAARALIAHENSVEIKSTALDIAKKLKSDYDTLLKKHDLITDPFAMAQNMFTDDITKFPKVNIGQIFSYILRMKFSLKFLTILGFLFCILFLSNQFLSIFKICTHFFLYKQFDFQGQG